MTHKLILASSSPRRQQLLADCGLAFEVMVSGAIEARLDGETPQQMAERLAVLKATDISKRNPGAWVIGADTDVCVDGEILGKPVDAADAERMLSKIQGREHSVWGAFAILKADSNICVVRSHETVVRMAQLTAQEIKRYVQTGEPMDKAGAYAAQEKGSQLIQEIRGSYTNVVGLNTCALMMELKKLGAIS